MTIPSIDTYLYEQKARQIRGRVVPILAKWGLLPRFKRWRLTQDPDSGMIVLFAVLNNRVIAKQTSIPFRNYFDPGVLRDLANELQVQVVTCNSDGLRYAFILDRGQLKRLPSHIDYPFIESGKVLVRVVYSDIQKPAPVAPEAVITNEEHAQVHQGVAAFLKVFDDIKLREDAKALLAAQSKPDIQVINELEFDRRIAEHETGRPDRRATSR